MTHPSEAATPPVPPADPTAERQARLAERLLEDEALRRGLSGDAWAPIQAWLLNEARRWAATTTALDNAAFEAALEAESERLRTRVRRLVQRLPAGEHGPDPATVQRALAQVDRRAPG